MNWKDTLILVLLRTLPLIIGIIIGILVNL